MQENEICQQIYLDDLPYEVIEKITQYLSPADRKDCVLVNKKFCLAAHNASKIILNLNYCRLEDNCTPFSLFLNSWREYRKIIIGGDIEFGVGTENFWKKFGETTQELTFDFSPFLTIDILVSILKHMKKLKVLNISCRKEYFLNGSNLVDDNNREYLQDALQNLKVLSINGTNLTNVQFSNLLQLTPRLESLNLYFCHEIEGNSNEVQHYLTCTDILQTIENHQTLQEINLDDFGYKILNEQNLLLELERKHRLKKISFPLLNIDTELLVNFFGKHKDIKVLGLGSGIRTSCDNLKIIINNLPNLEELNVEATGTLQTLSCITELPNLKSLRIANYTNGFTFETETHIGHNLKTRPKLRKIEIHSDNKICCDCFSKIAQCFENLTVLKLPHNNIDDSSVQVINKKLKWLQKLCLTGCKNITDKGIIGWRLGDDQKMVMSEEHSIQNLKGLRSLSLSGCEEVTNCSLLTSFKLTELRKLKIGSLKKISELGVEALVQGCPQIELLDVGGCENINDNCIKEIAAKLRRLRFLDIHGCRQVTGISWNHLANYARNLQILNSWNCGLTVFLSDYLFSKIDSLKLICYEHYARRFEYVRRHKGT